MKGATATALGPPINLKSRLSSASNLIRAIARSGMCRRCDAARGGVMKILLSSMSLRPRGATTRSMSSTRRLMQAKKARKRSFRSIPPSPMFEVRHGRRSCCRHRGRERRSRPRSNAAVPLGRVETFETPRSEPPKPRQPPALSARGEPPRQVSMIHHTTIWPP